jgi:archaellum biogenesis ATPase FlaH
LVNIVEEITNNQFLLILLQEDQYLKQLERIVKSVEKNRKKICYVCLSKPYTDVIETLKGRKINTSKFFFIDVLSSHYQTPKPVSNCIFVPAPSELEHIKVAIAKAVNERKCGVIIIDTISTLLMYEEGSSIVRFTHELTIERKQEDVKKLFIVLKKDSIPEKENKELLKDLSMFADKIVDLVK